MQPTHMNSSLSSNSTGEAPQPVLVPSPPLAAQTPLASIVADQQQQQQQLQVPPQSMAPPTFTPGQQQPPVMVPQPMMAMPQPFYMMPPAGAFDGAGGVPTMPVNAPPGWMPAPGIPMMPLATPTPQIQPQMAYTQSQPNSMLGSPMVPPGTGNANLPGHGQIQLGNSMRSRSGSNKNGHVIESSGKVLYPVKHANAPASIRNRNAEPIPVPEDPLARRQLIVNFLPQNCSSNELMNLFAPYGNIVQARVINHRRSRESRCFGFVYFRDEESAANALVNLTGSEYQGKFLRVSFTTNPASAPSDVDQQC